MKLVICDDNLEDLAKLKRLLQIYRRRCPDIRIETELFSDAAPLLQQIRREEPADIYILDILLSDLTGIDLGTEIRKKNGKSVIIYVTSSDSFALDAYNIFAARYLLKPVDENRFFETMDYALFNSGTKTQLVYLVKTKNGLESIPYPEIEYIENCSRKLEIHLVNKDKITSIYMRQSFEEETKELLTAKNFIYVHKSFLINLNCVRKLSQSHLVMNSGASIPVSRKRIPDVKKEYLLFVSGQYH